MPVWGEKLLDRYIRHPPAGSLDTSTEDGQPLDGQAMIWRSNLAHLAEMAPRPLVYDASGIGFSAFADSPWDHFSDEKGPSTTELGAYSNSDHRNIPWDRRSSFRYGPFSLIQDDTSTVPGVPRSVRFNFRITLGAGSNGTRTWFLLSVSKNPRDIVNGNILGVVYNGSLTGTGDFEIEDTVEADVPILSGTEAWTTRNAVDRGRLITPVIPYYAWIGVYALRAVTVNSISIFEDRR